MDLGEIYAGFQQPGEAQQLLLLQHWYSSVAQFDPITGEPQPLSLAELLHRAADPELNEQVQALLAPSGAQSVMPPQGVEYRDWLWRIADHATIAFTRITAALNESPQRTHAEMPLRNVRELDGASFIAMNRRPGRTAREKLAAHPTLPAVRRYQSVDLPQNHLVKAFAMQMVPLLELRKAALGHEPELLETLVRWLRSDEAQAIARWRNLPPNNTLLSHRDYSRVWKAWTWLQTVDQLIEQQRAGLSQWQSDFKYWQSKAQNSVTKVIANQPVLFPVDRAKAYRNFSIKVWGVESSKALAPDQRKKPLASGFEQVKAAPVCIDLTRLQPVYATAGGAIGGVTEGVAGGAKRSKYKLTDIYAWQFWQRRLGLPLTPGPRTGNELLEQVEFPLFDADSIYLHPDSQTVTSPMLFFSSGDGVEPALLERAAHAFVERLHQQFKNPNLVWLVPDILNDFQLQVIRHNLNFRFPLAEPLPRSVAAVFQLPLSQLHIQNGYKIAVIDSHANQVWVTRLTAKISEPLKKLIPESQGIYWERSPSVPLPHSGGVQPVSREVPSLEVPWFDAAGTWHDAVAPTLPPQVSPAQLPPAIGKVDKIIVANAPVKGGAKYLEWQQLAGGIPLWRDHLPRLAIEAYDQRNQRSMHVLVGNKTVDPIRSQRQEIPIEKQFVLPAGRPFYEFTLVQGEAQDKLNYVARLDSPQFKLAADTVCHLRLNYFYGANDPYQLVFEPVDKSINPIKAKWQLKEKRLITTAPQFPPAIITSWADLRTWKDAQGNPDDLQKWLIDSLSQLLSRVPDQFPMTEFAEQKFRSYRTNSLLNRIAIVFGDGRSLSDSDCPLWFADKFSELSQALLTQVPEPLLSQKIYQLFAYLDRDVPYLVTDWLLGLEGRTRNGNRPYTLDRPWKQNDAKALGAALGSLQKAWQLELLNSMSDKPNQTALFALSYAIWRNPEIAMQLKPEQIKRLLNSIVQELGNVKPIPPAQKQFKGGSQVWARNILAPLELLLGLLRSRLSSDPKINSILQPDEAISRELEKRVNQVADIVAQSGSTGLPTRIKFGDLTDTAAASNKMDIFSALRMYLSGNDGANAIRIIGVIDSDEN